ncbi:hypothetical protein CDES_11170 [Corynebacterium deserti GIMN1.010]|uniref:Uncharacterized protein n=1 Tax=Corynebacterium deserti GIMN1.010 TaxID=931089 RepID=A0A0M4CF14_9CORY|nr:hypothetical protein CDES_11170 [Corynebacterium deserti GIMN1.010]
MGYGGEASKSAFRVGVLRNSSAERPVLFGHFHKVDKEILGADPNLFVEITSEGGVKLFLELDGPASVAGDLNDAGSVGAFDEIGGIHDEGSGLIRIDNDKFVVEHACDQLDNAPHHILQCDGEGENIAVPVISVAHGLLKESKRVP